MTLTENERQAFGDFEKRALAQLSLAAAARFDGKSVTGEPVTLTR